MKITVQSAYETLDIPIDAKLNIEIGSPIFSKAGAMSLPISLPLTNKNRRLLQFPDRMDIFDSEEGAIRAIPDISVIITQGSWQQVATMSISGCSEESIEVTLYFNESNFWSQLDGLTLPQAMAGLHFGDIPPAGADLSIYRRNTFDTLNYRLDPTLDPTYDPYDDGDRSIRYPNMIDHREIDGTITRRQWEDMLVERSYYLEGLDFVIAPLYTPDGWLNKFNKFARGGDVYTLDDPDSNFSNITVFLRLEYVLNKVFAKIGKTLVVDFSSAPDFIVNELAMQWKSICVLNNTKDALYPGCIYYSSLVPEISCKDFLESVMSQFGCFFKENKDGTVLLVFTQKILSVLSGKRLGLFSNKQITFNSSPEYKPIDGMENHEDPNIEYHSVDLYSGAGITHLDWNSTQWQRDAFPHKVLVPTLEGLNQRTTTTTINGEDETKDKECPLVFANLDFTVAYEEGEYTENNSRYYYPCLRNNYLESFGHGIGLISYKYKETSDGSLYSCLNERYNHISENSDKITLTKELSMIDLIDFDFTQPFVFNGRVLWPSKLQFELQEKETQLVTIEMISSRQ